MALKAPPIFFCAECGNPDYRTMPNKIYCSETCRQKAWNRRITGGFKLYELAMRWRIDREKGDMAELTGIADQLAADERMLRARRAANIKQHQKDGIKGSLPPDFQPGENRSRNVSLSKPQQEAACEACVFALAFAAGRVPNDPDLRPDGWSDKRIAELRNAVVTLGGKIDPDEFEAA
jgi:hypothetical protein